MKYAILFLTLITFAVSGQTAQKIGYADTDYIFANIPDYKTIEADLKAFAAQLQKQMDTKSKEYQTKLVEFQQYGPEVADAIKKSAQRDLEQLGANLQQLKEDSESDLNKRQNTLMQPVIAKISKAIEDVAAENGFDMILNAQIQGLDVVLWGKKETDVSDLVLKKLGGTVPVTPEATK